MQMQEHDDELDHIINEHQREANHQQWYNVLEPDERHNYQTAIDYIRRIEKLQREQGNGAKCHKIRSIECEPFGIVECSEFYDMKEYLKKVPALVQRFDDIMSGKEKVPYCKPARWSNKYKQGD